MDWFFLLFSIFFFSFPLGQFQSNEYTWISQGLGLLEMLKLHHCEGDQQLKELEREEFELLGVEEQEESVVA